MSRFVPAPPVEVARVLTPETVVAAEGSFDVREVAESGEATLVRAGRLGVELRFRFERRDDGLAYDQVEGPLETLRTTVTCTPEDEGSRLTARSTVAVGGPAALDRLAAWKRRGELERALAGIERRL